LITICLEWKEYKVKAKESQEKKGEPGIPKRCRENLSG
jgi:hypothetical protein